MSIHEYLTTMLNTLDKIEVHGAENLSRMLGAIEATENMLKHVEVKDSGRQSDTRPDTCTDDQ